MIIFYHLGWPRRVMNYRVNDVMFHSVLNRSTKMFYSMKRIQIIGDHTYSIINYQKSSMENANDWLFFRTWDDLEQSCQIVFSLWCYILIVTGQLFFLSNESNSKHRRPHFFDFVKCTKLLSPAETKWYWVAMNNVSRNRASGWCGRQHQQSEQDKALHRNCDEKKTQELESCRT